MESKSTSWEEFEERFAKLQEKKAIEAKIKIEKLNNQAKLLPLKNELLKHIHNLIRWLDLSNEWFIKSRDLSVSKEEQKLNEVIYEFYKKRSDLILEELVDFLPKEVLDGR